MTHGTASDLQHMAAFLKSLENVSQKQIAGKKNT
jgi:hypothetical protein